MTEDSKIFYVFIGMLLGGFMGFMMNGKITLTTGVASNEYDSLQVQYDILWNVYHECDSVYHLQQEKLMYYEDSIYRPLSWKHRKEVISKGIR